jgi:hypothetical protein
MFRSPREGFSGGSIFDIVDQYQPGARRSIGIKSRTYAKYDSFEFRFFESDPPSNQTISHQGQYRSQ